MSLPKNKPAAKLEQYRCQEKDSLGQDGGAEQGEETSLGTDTGKVLEAIATCQKAVTVCQTTLTTRIEVVKVDISLVRQDFQKVRERVTEAEGKDSPPPSEFHRYHAAAGESAPAEAV